MCSHSDKESYKNLGHRVTVTELILQLLRGGSETTSSHMHLKYNHINESIALNNYRGQSISQEKQLDQ